MNGQVLKMIDFLLFSACDRLSESNWSAAAGYPGGVLQQWTAPYNATANGGAATAAASNNNNNNNNHSASSLVSSTPPGVGVATASQPSRVVVIHRDERGFGFVVAGDNPVFVQTVREGTASAMGLRRAAGQKSQPHATGRRSSDSLIFSAHALFSPFRSFIGYDDRIHQSTHDDKLFIYFVHFFSLVNAFNLQFRPFGSPPIFFFPFSFRFAGGAAERAGIVKDDIIIKVFNVH